MSHTSRSILVRVMPFAAAALLSVLLAACGSTPKDKDDGKSVAALYEEAREEASSGGYERAQKLYEKLEGRAAGTLLAQQAQIEQAYLLYKQRETARALAVLERFLRLHPTSPAADYAYYLQGLINFNDDLGLFGNWVRTDLSERDQQASRDAYQSFKQVVERFPESKYAPDAQTRMDYIVNSLAGYEVHVARYYFKRGAYVAAANRAQLAVKDFRGVPAAEEALYIMAASYDQLGLPQLRDDARRVLQQNFPKSAWLDKGYDTTPKSWWKLF
ncbi:MAG: outer membrane protein assembly factor BamD [Burkholderiales bacterium]